MAAWWTDGRPYSTDVDGGGGFYLPAVNHADATCRDGNGDFGKSDRQPCAFYAQAAAAAAAVAVANRAAAAATVAAATRERPRPQQEQQQQQQHKQAGSSVRAVRVVV